MIFIICGLVATFFAWKAEMSDGFMIANAILISAMGIVDKLWDIRICLTELKEKLAESEDKE